MLEISSKVKIVFLFQPAGSGKFESFASGMSDSKVKKERDKPEH